MFIIPFAIIDILVGIALASSPYFELTGNTIVFYLAILAIIKGVYSILAAMANGFYWDIIGWVDVIAGILLWLTTMGLESNIFLYIGIIVIVKGIYSFAVGLMVQN